MIRFGRDKVSIDVSVLRPINKAPTDGSCIIGVRVSTTGHLLQQEPVSWVQYEPEDFAPTQCPANVEEWCGWFDGEGFVFPSHFCKAEDWQCP